MDARHRTLALVISFVWILSDCTSPDTQEAVRESGMPPLPYHEQVVHAVAEDGISNVGVLIQPVGRSPKSMAVIWLHGWGVNFYFPSYLTVGREMAKRGYSFLSVNSRMHDVGSIAGWRDGRRILGGGYFGRASDQTLDLAAWVELATRDHEAVILVGHSAGGTAARQYQFQRQDERVRGIVLASTGLHPPPRLPDEVLRVASEMVSSGRGQDLLPRDVFRGNVSAATVVDLDQMPNELRDFFGFETPSPAMVGIRCPILVWFGTEESGVGSAEDLVRLEEHVAELPGSPPPLETVILTGADHMYSGEESEVAATLDDWIAQLQAK